MNTERPTPPPCQCEICLEQRRVRQLETELAEAWELIHKHQDVIANQMQWLAKQKEELTEAREELARLKTHPEPLPRPDGPDVFLSQYFQALRMDPKHTLGLGDIRLTYGQQEELVYRNCAPKKEGEG